MLYPKLACSNSILRYSSQYIHSFLPDLIVHQRPHPEWGPTFPETTMAYKQSWSFLPFFNVRPNIQLVGEGCPRLRMEVPVRIRNLAKNHKSANGSISRSDNIGYPVLRR